MFASLEVKDESHVIRTSAMSVIAFGSSIKSNASVLTVMYS